MKSGLVRDGRVVSVRRPGRSQILLERLDPTTVYETLPASQSEFTTRPQPELPIVDRSHAGNPSEIEYVLCPDDFAWSVQLGSVFRQAAEERA